jgi:MSHA biogenesis protein MshO
VKRDRCVAPAGSRPGGGFSLIEFIVVIAIVGILGAVVAVFMANPVRAYLDAVRRSELTDSADTALIRIARDVRLALPNSVRVSQNGGIWYLEYLPLHDGGRYRAEPTGAGAGDPLDFSSGSDDRFDVLGPPVSAQAGDFVVIYNLGLDAGTDAYQGGNRRDYAGATGSVAQVQFSATGSPFPHEAPGRRFFLAGGPVTYVCDPATQTLRRYAGYAIQAAQPVAVAAAPLAGAGSQLLADRVLDCRFDYQAGAAQRLGQLMLWLRLGDNQESVSLYREVGVDNAA